VEFRSDAETGQIVVRVVNPDTGELLRQIPSQDAIALARALGKLQGSFLEQKA
jgi:flagellar protein FlaG